MRTKYQNGLIRATRLTPANNSKTTPANGIFTKEFVSQLINSSKWPKHTESINLYYGSPGTYSVVIPAGVSQITLTGRGGDNTTSYSTTPVSASNFVDNYYLTYSGSDCFGVDVGTDFNSEYSSRSSTCQSFLNGISSSIYSNYSVPGGYYMYCTTTGRYLRYVSNIGAELARLGGTLYQRFTNTVWGQNSSGFGYTFNANSSQSSYSVSVSPGTYSITVGAGSASFIQIVST